MVEAPERIRVAQDADGFWTCREAISGSQEYTRADIAERQNAELRAELINRVNYWSELYSKEYHRAKAAEAENARLSEANKELHRRAQSAEGRLQKASTVAREHIKTLESVATRSGHWPAGSHWAKRAMECWLESALSDPDVQPTLPLKDERHLTLDEQKTFDDVLRNSGAVRQVLPLKDEVERVLGEAHEFIETSAFNVPTKDYFDAVLKDIDALLSRLRAGEREGWRGMSSAPGDEETPVLLWINGQCAVGLTWKRRDGTVIGKASMFGNSIAEYWQPLPASPSVSEGGSRNG